MVEFTKKPAGKIAIDSAITAGINAALLIVGSRFLKSADLGPLTMMQLFASSAVILQRSTLLSPGLSARRALGAEAIIPLRWAVASVPILTLVVVSIAPLAMNATQPRWQVLLVCAAFTASLLFQDFVRYVFISHDSAGLAIRMDFTWLVSTACLVAVPLLHPSWMLLSTTWATAAISSAVLAAATAHRRLRTPRLAVRLRDTLKLGRWGGLDNLMSIIANLAPMVVTTLVLATPLAASYRILQTALGPLNIINTTLIVTFGLDSYKLTSVNELKTLDRRVRKSATYLAIGSVIYTSVAFFLISSLAGIDYKTAVRVGVVLAIAALLGAATTPATAAASALGYQAIGVAIRVFVVAASLLISWAAAIGGPIPWDDPIGAVSILAATLGLAGWGTGYIFAARRERLLLT
ncbi:hypothetical protein [Curtobacterium sp. Leaf261]|uniref:hypothetical protein n=1 Tax=Curtobacterium sp. Leaf261 TaxID=1736311 RepID=UPI0012E1D6DD|nr:hypothetical protein [Curtobacterium sp. Leaf261]